MTVEIVLVILVIVIAVGFDFTNGFHDAANAIATSVSTRALTPRAALLMAAVMNMVGALLSTSVAKTIAEDIVDLGSLDKTDSHLALTIVLTALIGAVVWNLITWRLGLPSSSSHALIGGLVGAGLAAAVFSAGVSIFWGAVVQKVVLPMIISPIIGFGLAYLLMVAVLWIFRNAAPTKTFRRFKLAQTVSAAAMALGHGLQDAQKTMGVIFMALLAVQWGGVHNATDDIPLWVKLLAATAISLGTASGGWRIMRTLGRKVIELDPARGFVAESVAAGVLYTTSFWLHVPVSTTHTITSAIMGVGATKRLSAVRWGVAGNIATAWVLTIPAAAGVAAACYFLFHFVFGLLPGTSFF